MQIIFDDKDLEELITTGRNSKYKKYTRNRKFMEALATAYNYLRFSERASDLRSISTGWWNVYSFESLTVA